MQRENDNVDVAQPEPTAAGAYDDGLHVDIDWASWNTTWKHLDIDRRIGCGEFGEVAKGIMRGTGENEGMSAMVAIKTLKSGATRAAFLQEVCLSDYPDLTAKILAGSHRVV